MFYQIIRVSKSVSVIPGIGFSIIKMLGHLNGGLSAYCLLSKVNIKMQGFATPEDNPSVFLNYQEIFLESYELGLYSNRKI